MAVPTLVLDAALRLVAAGLYAYVGHVLARRPAHGGARLATGLFSTWWYALAAATLATAAMLLAGAAEVRDVALYATLVHLIFLALCVALVGLLYYLLYLFTGSRRWLPVVAIYYGGLYAYTLYLLAHARPTDVAIEPWRVSLVYATPPAGAVGVAWLALLSAPILLGALGYARLYFAVRDRTPRYRIGMVSATLLLWFGSTLVVTVLGESSSPAWQVASRLVGVAGALLIYLAYRPPAWVRERFGIHAVDEDAAHPG